MPTQKQINVQASDLKMYSFCCKLFCAMQPSSARQKSNILLLVPDPTRGRQIY